MSDVKYLFLVPYGDDGEWQLATKDGLPCVSNNFDHFGGRMPKIIASEHLLASGNYYDFEKNLPKFQGI